MIPLKRYLDFAEVCSLTSLGSFCPWFLTACTSYVYRIYYCILFEDGSM